MLSILKLKKEIIDGILKPGQSIIEEQIASDLGISRTPIREALQRLEMEELIVRQTNGRLKIAPITTEEVEEIFNVRSLLEGLVIREATINATENDIQKLKQLTQLLTKAADYDQREEVVYYGSEFHLYLYGISGNKTATKILMQLNDHIARYRRLGPNEKSERGNSAAMEHKQIFEAISERDPKKAENLMKDHIMKSLVAAVDSIKKIDYLFSRRFIIFIKSIMKALSLFVVFGFLFQTKVNYAILRRFTMSTHKAKNISFKNPGIIMTIIQLLYVVFIFTWFPTNRGWFELPIIVWLMIAGFFIWAIQSVVFVYWAEKIEQSGYEEVKGKREFKHDIKG